jgi:hypothetical protein
MIEFSALREDLAELYREKLTRSEFLYLSSINTKAFRKPDEKIGSGGGSTSASSLRLRPS